MFVKVVTCRRSLVVGGGTPWRCWLGHCATSRKAAGSMPDGAIEIFLCYIPSGSLWREVDSACKKNEYRNISWGVKAAGVWG